jgi:glycosyltransferase involved in cell wall biosynthesis
MPRVSVIMNVRNGVATLRAALESAIHQTYRDWELIVWDDRSSDDSAKIAAGFTDFRIRHFLSPEVTSLGQARDSAILQACGEWLAFLDQDDIWLPHKLELQIALADSPQTGLIYGRSVSFGSRGGERDYDQFHEFSALPEGDILAELLGRGCFIAMSSALIRRSAVNELGGIPADVRIIPDYYLYLAVCRKYQARAVQEVVCRYRVHPKNMTRIYRRESLEETLTLIENWSKRVPPETLAKRHTGISTALALEELRHWKTVPRGAARLADEGSIFWLAGRPFVHLWRVIRRRLQKPQWKQSAGGYRPNG